MTIPNSQLTTMRDPTGQYTLLYLAKFEPNIVFAAQINDANITKGAKLITFDTVVTGSFSNIQAGQTCYIGSTLNGNDVGRVRVRSATATQLTVAVDNGIQYINRQYLTVKEYYEIWPVFPFTALNTGTNVATLYKDWDIAYSDQNLNFDPVIIMGPDFAGFYDNNILLTGVYFTATGTYTVDGSTISTYAWTFPAGCTPTSSSSGTPGNVLFPGAGMYTVKLQVTASNGKVATSYRHIALLNRHYGQIDQPAILQYEDIADWQFNEITQDHISGHIAKITVRNRANEFRPGDLVMIFAEDYYQGIPQSYGGYPGRENVVFVGYLDQADTTYDPFISKTDFVLKNSASYLNNKEMFSVLTIDTQGTPSSWTYIKNQTIQKALIHYMRWHTTLLNVKDFNALTNAEGGNFTEDIIEIQKGEILTNLNNFVQQKLLGFFGSDRQSNCFTEIDLNIIQTGSRPASTMVFQEGDWIGETKITEVIEQPFSNILVGGVAYVPGTIFNTGTPMLARAPGQWQTYIGKSQNVSGLTLYSQQQLDNLAGMDFYKLNNPTPEVELDLAYNMRNIDIYPQQFYDFNISGTATLYRGLNWKPKRLIPRKATITYKDFMLQTKYKFEPETYGPPGDTIVIPTTLPGGTCTDCNVPPPCDCAKNPSCEGCIPPVGVGDGNTVYVMANGFVGRTRNFLTTSPNWENVTNTTAGTGNGSQLILDPWGPVAGAYRAYVDIVEHTANLNDSPPTWTSVLTATAIQSALSLVSVPSIRKICGSITESNLVYVGWDGHGAGGGPPIIGISVSTNSGATWNHYIVASGTDTPQCMRIIADPTIPGKIWYLGNLSNAGRLHSSTNHGASWATNLITGFNSLFDFDISFPDAGQTIVIKSLAGGGGDNNMYYSHNGGASFTSVINAISHHGATTLNWIWMNIATTDQNDVIWADQDKYIWRSLDGGITWSVLGNYGAGVTDSGLTFVSVGRWPYDVNKIFWLFGHGGVNPVPGIGYSSDAWATQQDKTGDWVSVFGSNVTAPVTIVPLWLAY